MSISSKPSYMKSTESTEHITNITQARNLTLEQLNKVLSGKADLEQIHAFCEVMKVVLDTLKVEINYLKMAQKTQSINFITNDSKLIENKG